MGKIEASQLSAVWTLYKIHQTTIQRGTKNDVTAFFYGGVGGKDGWVLVWGLKIRQQAYLVVFNCISHQGSLKRTPGVEFIQIATIQSTCTFLNSF